MLDIWLVPALAIVFAAVACFYVLMRFTGGHGARTEGKTIVDKEVEEPKVQSGWNVYR